MRYFLSHYSITNLTLGLLLWSFSPSFGSSTGFVRYRSNPSDLSGINSDEATDLNGYKRSTNQGKYDLSFSTDSLEEEKEEDAQFRELRPKSTGSLSYSLKRAKSAKSAKRARRHNRYLGEATLPQEGHGTGEKLTTDRFLSKKEELARKAHEYALDFSNDSLEEEEEDAQFRELRPKSTGSLSYSLKKAKKGKRARRAAEKKPSLKQGFLRQDYEGELESDSGSSDESFENDLEESMEDDDSSDDSSDDILEQIEASIGLNQDPLISSLVDEKTLFYIYDDDVIAQTFVTDKLRRLGSLAYDPDTSTLDHLETDAMSEYNVLNALLNHPLRTDDPNEAGLFIVPTPVTELILYGCRTEDCSWFDEAFSALMKHPLYVATGGHNHVLCSFNWLSFSNKFKAFIPALSRNYPKLENVTIAHHFDPFGASKLQESAKWSDFNALWSEEGKPVSKAFSVGLGLGFDEAFPRHSASYEKFLGSDNFIFYHTADRDFHYGSTKYRDALINAYQQAPNRLLKSSIGHSVDHQIWKDNIAASKYCLVIRGDTPHSHALFSAVRAGCLPVVISDYYADYAPPLKSSLNMEDFSIFLPEDAFLHDPIESILALERLPLDFIKTKLENLAVAQAVLMPDHSQSVFVQAFLKEAKIASSMDESLLQRGKESNPTTIAASTTLSGKDLNYIIPSTFGSASVSEDGSPSLIIGVLSSASNYNARFSIRQTWAEGHKGHVFFVVAGPWDTIEQEFFDEGDIIWIDMKENFRFLSYKTETFLHAVNTWTDDKYDYIMKTDDDSYVGLPAISTILKQDKPDFWGYCMFEEKYRRPFRDPSDDYYVSEETFPGDLYPVWAQGMGYILSRSFNQCAMHYFPTMSYMPMEDVAVGMAAEHCQVECSRDDWKNWNDYGLTAPIRVQHFVEDADDMIFTHWANMRLEGIGEWGQSKDRS